MEIAAIFCFPLDLEVTSFGTLYRHSKAGHEVNVIIIRDGINLWTPKYKDLLYSSCKQISVSRVQFCDKFDFSSVTQNNAMRVNTVIREMDPEMVIIPFWKSVNHKCAILSRTSLIACRGIPNIIMYDLDSQGKLNPNIRVDLSITEVSIKMEILNRYRHTEGKWKSVSPRRHISDEIATDQSMKSDPLFFVPKRVYMGKNYEYGYTNSDLTRSRSNKLLTSRSRYKRLTQLQSADLFNVWNTEYFEAHRISLV